MGEPTADKSDHRQLKYLDQNNLANAYVSGMQEDLQMYGNEYTYAQTAYTCAYAIMQIPSTLVIQRVKPSWWLAAMEVAWGTFTFAQAGLRNNTQLYVFRFMIGFFESSWFPCMLFVLGSWYTKTELAKRIAIFHMTAPIGTAFSGYLQAAVYQNLNGVHGLAGWRWLYIICGVMTLPVGIVTAFFFPDTPHKTTAFFLSKEERELGIARIQRAGKAAPAALTFSKAGKILRSWRWWLLVLGYVNSSYFAIWLKAEKFSVEMRNIIPTGTSLISGFCVVLWGFLSDYTGSRFAFIIGPLTFGLLPTGILAFWPASVQLKEFAFLTAGVQLMTAIFYTWANEICADNNEERALVVSSMNGFQYAVAAWLPILIFPQLESPTFRKGFPSTFGFTIAAIICVCAIQWFAVRENKQKAAAARAVEQPAEEGSVVGSDAEKSGSQPARVGHLSYNHDAVIRTYPKLAHRKGAIAFNVLFKVCDSFKHGSSIQYPIMSRNVCVTAADGHTGFTIVELLLGDIFAGKVDSVIALVLDMSSDRAKQAKDLGAKVVEHKHGRERTVVKTLKDTGCDTICLIPPTHHDKKDITIELLHAAKKAEVANVLLISSAGCDFADPQKQPRLREFIEFETLLLSSKGDSGVVTGHSPCVIRAGFYAENLLLYAPQARDEGILPLPIGKSHKFAPVALGDVAHVAALVLTGKGEHGFDDKHRGQMMVTTGPELCAGEELATAASKALGTELKFENISQAEAKKVLKAQSDADQSELDYLLEYYSLVREGKTNYIATTAFVNATGTHPTEPTEFFKMYDSELKRPTKKAKRKH
ncbi:major facilitator superfamily transporter [Seiridium cupressi]